MAIVLFATAPQALSKRVHFAQIAFPNFARSREDLRNLLQAVELDQSHEWKLQFVRIHRVENDDFIASKTEMLDSIQHGLLVIKKVADDNDDALPSKLARHVVQHRCDIGLLLRFE